MSRQALDELKQQISLLDYLQTHDWHPARDLSGGRLMGLCPLHADHNRASSSTVPVGNPIHGQNQPAQAVANHKF